jgi:hypothetical protein
MSGELDRISNTQNNVGSRPRRQKEKTKQTLGITNNGGPSLLTTHTN